MIIIHSVYSRKRAERYTPAQSVLRAVSAFDWMDLRVFSDWDLETTHTAVGRAVPASRERFNLSICLDGRDKRRQTMGGIQGHDAHVRESPELGIK